MSRPRNRNVVALSSQETLHKFQLGRTEVPELEKRRFFSAGQNQPWGSEQKRGKEQQQSQTGGLAREA